MKIYYLWLNFQITFEITKIYCSVTPKIPRFYIHSELNLANLSLAKMLRMEVKQFGMTVKQFGMPFKQFGLCLIPWQRLQALMKALQHWLLPS